MLKNVFEITGGLPILVWEGEGGACQKATSQTLRPVQLLRIVENSLVEPTLDVQPVIQSELALHGYSKEELYFSNLSDELKARLKKEALFVRPDRLDGSDCPEIHQIQDPSLIPDGSAGKSKH
jgi:hypothetical protein